MKKPASFVYLLALLFSFNLFAATEGRTISVTGQCIRKVAPDRGSVTLVAQFADKSASVASKKAMETYEKVRKAVVKLGLKDLELQTSEYSVQELFDYNNNKRISKGFQASLGLNITTSEISKLGEVVGLSSQIEINRVENLSTFLSQERTKTSQESCLVEAIKNARDKAEKMATSALAKVGEVQSIEENPEGPSQVPHPEAKMAEVSMARDMGGPIAPNIESKNDTVNVKVLVKFSLK